MAINFNVNVKLSFDSPVVKEILSQLHLLNKKTNQIMAKIDELNQLVSDLQISVDTKQSAIAAAILALDARIAELQAIIDAGGGTSDTQLQSVIDNLTSTKADLEATPTA